MTVSEFSNGFDTLVSSYKRFKDFDNQEFLDSIEFDEYEKSLYLTRAQEDLVISLYSGKNAFRENFEETEELRRYLSDLQCEDKITAEDNLAFTGISSYSKFFSLPYSLWFITYEAVRVASDNCWNGKDIEVIPVRQDWYHRQHKNPFRGLSAKKAFRLDMPGELVEIVYPGDIEYYYVRYLHKPCPIILRNLPNGLSIEGISNQHECDLHTALHQRILQEAVILALQSKGINVRERNSNRPVSEQQGNV